MIAFQHIVNHIDYPMWIVTAVVREELAGCLVSYATQCSIHPPRFVAFLSRENHTFRVAREADTLIVHLVPPRARRLAELFGGRTGDDIDKFGRCRWRAGPEGAPILEDCESWFAGSVVTTCEGGDHVGFVLEPMTGEAGSIDALGFQEAKGIEAGHPA